MEGHILCQGDKSSCGGTIIGGNLQYRSMGRAIAREGDKVTCGITGQVYLILGGIHGMTDMEAGRNIAGTLDSFSSCPCQAKLYVTGPAMKYRKASGHAGPAVMRTSTPAESVQTGQALHAEKQAVKLPPYLTGEKDVPGFLPDYPVLRNSRELPDEVLRAMLRANNQDVMFLTLEEIFEVLASWGAYKQGWTSITQSGPGQIVVSYGTNIKDVVTTSMIISQLGSFSIRATMYVNHKGTELIKLSGYPGIRAILNAPVFAAKNPKVVDLGIGKYGLRNSIASGARLTFYVAGAFRTLDFILNDETSLANFIGSLATDVVKIGIASVITWGIGATAVTFLPFVSMPLVVVVAVGFIAAWSLNKLDDKFGVTDKLISYIEHSQQEFVEKARKIEGKFIDLGAMFADRMLEKGMAFAEEEVRIYFRRSLDEIIPRGF